MFDIQQKSDIASNEEQIASEPTHLEISFLATETASRDTLGHLQEASTGGTGHKEVEEEEVLSSCSCVCVFNNFYSTGLITR